MDRIANTSEFNGTKLLNGKSSKSVLDFQIGSKGTSNDRIQLSLKDYDVSTASLGIDGLDSKSLESSRSALESIDQAISHVSDARAGLGGLQARLQSATQTLSVREITSLRLIPGSQIPTLLKKRLSLLKSRFFLRQESQCLLKQTHLLS